LSGFDLQAVMLNSVITVLTTWSWSKDQCK